MLTPILEKRPLPTPNVSAHPLLDEMVLELSEKQVILSLNQTARAIWELCDGQRTVQEIAQTLSADLGGLADTEFATLLLDVETAVLQFQN